MVHTDLVAGRLAQGTRALVKPSPESDTAEVAGSCLRAVDLRVMQLEEEAYDRESTFWQCHESCKVTGR